MASAAAPDRFLALDSLRGICALLVALFHLKTTGYLTNSTFIRESWLFVDFFFVLSGFVIAHAYGVRLAGGFPLRRFLWLRFWRLYPLHVAVLLVFVAFELAKPLLADTGLANHAPFASPRSWDELIASLALVQFIAFPDYLTWNTPSWSIATEIWAYLFAALLFARAGRWAMPLAALVAATGFVVLLTGGDPFLHRTYSWLALMRCLYGFSLGVIIWHIFTTRLRGRALSVQAASVVELAMLALIGAVVLAAGGGMLTLAAPPLFALCVLVFAQEGGVVSQLLRAAPFTLLGTLSFSIYLTHSFIEARLIDLAALVSARSGWNLATLEYGAEGRVKLLGPADAPVLADALALVCLAVIVAVSWLSYRLVERPARQWSRRHAI